MKRLSSSTADLPRAARPQIVHFGLGAFHRAHQAVYTEAPWGIAAVAPRSTDVVTALRAQDCLYSVTDPATRVVGSIVEALHLGSDAARVGELLASPEVTVVTLTITEKGYRGGPVIGALAAGLAGRFRRGGAPISVVSCDNMTGNGRVLERAVRESVTGPGRDRELAWLAESVAFPSTVVDRIVPATTPEHRARAAEALGLDDAVPVFAEPYRQWVLEDAFAAGTPPWDGARFVPDVTPFEQQKLRLLNGTHSALAYLGSAAGYETVADVLESEWGERFVRCFGAEASAALPGDHGPYVEQLVDRFRNPDIRHRLSQIGSDGSLKLPERWFGTLRDPGSTPLLELALAGWARATEPDAETGMTDPLAGELAACWSAPDDVEAVRRLLHLVGAPEDGTLPKSVARHLPALRAGRIEV
ncbi:mannitol dehydrogenase family protein [Amycolatopsis kentuckyensis]|uniref:mannitol dehydrogenase family protein n=1 Tax=Amycolatopsis kentuckyensis TaxID=218823 RepID=UPI000A3B874E|nr:mannitol dehydrogenase family protein [Amycolatopsis kentuckyensis]